MSATVVYLPPLPVAWAPTPLQSTVLRALATLGTGTTREVAHAAGVPPTTARKVLLVLAAHRWVRATGAHITIWCAE